jgi:CheY-like chemotaxis protein
MAEARPRVLVVEDSPSVRTTVAYILTGAGFDVLTAADGVEGLERIRRDRPRAVLLDVSMPRMDGFEVCRHVRAEAALRDTFIVMLTAKGQKADENRALEAGADRYLTKPVDEEAILRLLTEVLGAPGPGG